jgi:hypothetical protein
LVRQRREGRSGGLVYVDNSSFVDAFDEEDLGLVTAIASVAAVKIHTTRLLRESQALDAFSSGAPADDDRTLLVLKRVAPSGA